jgi:methylmalonyl-CoA/ethylmalonyl-CoA epimerase
MPESSAVDAWGLTFDHFGLATSDPARSLSVLRGLGYSCGSPVFDPLQNVNLVWGSHPTMPAVELIYPGDGPGPVTAILANQPESIYHLCYRSDNVPASLAAMKKAGHRAMTVVAQRPAVLFEHELVSFHLCRGLGLIELIQNRRQPGPRSGDPATPL